MRDGYLCICLFVFVFDLLSAEIMLRMSWGCMMVDGMSPWLNPNMVNPHRLCQGGTYIGTILCISIYESKYRYNTICIYKREHIGTKLNFVLNQMQFYIRSTIYYDAVKIHTGTYIHIHLYMLMLMIMLVVVVVVV